MSSENALLAPLPPVITTWNGLAEPSPVLTNCARKLVPDALMAATISSGVSFPGFKLIFLVAADTVRSVTFVSAVLLVKVRFAPLLTPVVKPDKAPVKAPPAGLLGVLPSAALA